MRWTASLSYLPAGLTWMLVLLPGATQAAPAAAPIVFGRDILPILSENCFRCHGPDQKARKAKLRLDVRAGALRVIVPGHSAGSDLIRRVCAASPKEVMPPRKSNRKLTIAQKELLRRWVDQGAAWGKHWAYEPPRRPHFPAVKDARWPRNAIDRFVLARLEKEGLGPSPEAAKETLVRRVALDLTGLPPTPKEVQAFVEDGTPYAYEKLVDRLLASQHYGERMAMDWLDAARYADTNGYQNDFARTMWPWRDWVIDAYNDNMPFDRFTVEQIAGDMLPGATLRQKIASGFNRNNRTVTEAGSIDDEWRVENNVDRVETTTTVFLGLTMGCARCHDHKYDPILQKDFYRFFAFFNSINEKGVYTEQRGNVPPLVTVATAADQARLKQLDVAVAAAESALREQEAALPALGKKWLKEQLSSPLAPVAAGSVLRYALDGRQEAEQQVTRLRQEREQYQKKIPTVMVMEELPKPRPTYLLKRGRYDMPDTAHKLDPGVPGCLPPLPPGVSHDRLALARWLVDPANPLTARVAINRFWQHYFGVGLVKTTEDFGVRGEMPSHPELLDWLATEFVRTRWDVKSMQKLIVTSAAYRQDAKVRPELLQLDPENRLLARGPRFRLPAEVVRDNALAVSGLLVAEVGVPSIKPYQPAGLWEELAGGAGEGPYLQDHGPSLYRRSLYIYRKRTVPHPVMATFDAPSREICQVKRQRTDTPLQALELLNDVTYVEAARQLGQRMVLQGGRTAAERLTFAFRLATARRPTAAELRVLTRGLERYLAIYRGDARAAKQFLRHGQAPVDNRLDPAEVAAHAAVATVILNLDETITKD